MMMRNPATYGAACVICAISALVWGDALAQGILETKHNLSVSGPGDIKALTEERVCIFCHTPHHASLDDEPGPLWSREMSLAVYDLYASTTLVSHPGQPTGSSRLCLSCHDGTVAIGMLYGGETIPMAGGVTTLPPGRPTNLTTDLSNDHPISFAYTAALAATNGELRDPAFLDPAISLDEREFIQCASCHNPHRDLYGKFLVMDNTGSRLCTACHVKTGWTGAVHAKAAGAAKGACGSCHVPHNADSPSRLLRKEEEEQVCFRCHDGTGAKNIMAIAEKPYNHPLDATTGVHDPTEDPLSSVPHVECVDCHNPHQADKGRHPSPPDAGGALAGVSGVNLSGVVVDPASYQYEVCFKCHSDNPFATPDVPRQIQDGNERLKFQTANPSYHPVAAPGKGASVPSLRPPLNPASMIYCTDCHNNDGPHACPVGSDYPLILAAEYLQDTYYPYSESNYALCFQCHNQTVLLGPSSAFPEHDSHVITRQVPCSACHDPHGVSLVLGATQQANAHLINFDTRFVSSGTYDSFARSCTVSCHATNPRSY